jgi:Siphovirus Gp157
MDTEKKLTMHDIVCRSNAITELLLLTEGELTPEIEEQLDYATKTLSNQVDACAVVIDRLEMESNIWADRAKKYSAIARAMHVAKERIRDMVKTAMVTMGTNEVAGDEVRFTLVESGKKVVLSIIPDDLPLQYRDTIVTYKANQDALKRALGCGITIQGAKLEDIVQLRKYPAKSVSV